MVVSEKISMVGSLLKKIAGEKGMSGKKLAKAVGVTPETVSRHMNGRTSMSKVDAMRYADVLGCDASMFIVDEQEIPIKGWIDTAHQIKLYSSLESKLLKGNLNLPSHVWGFIYPDTQETWMRGRILLVNGHHIKDNVITTTIMRNIAMCKVKGKDDIRLCVAYPDSSDMEVGIQRYTLLNPYYSAANASASLVQSVELDWGTPILLAIQDPSSLNMRVMSV